MVFHLDKWLHCFSKTIQRLAKSWWFDILYVCCKVSNCDGIYEQNLLFHTKLPAWWAIRCYWILVVSIGRFQCSWTPTFLSEANLGLSWQLLSTFQSSIWWVIMSLFSIKFVFLQHTATHKQHPLDCQWTQGDRTRICSSGQDGDSSHTIPWWRQCYICRFQCSGTCHSQNQESKILHTVLMRHRSQQSYQHFPSTQSH